MYESEHTPPWGAHGHCRCSHLPEVARGESYCVEVRVTETSCQNHGSHIRRQSQARWYLRPGSARRARDARRRVCRSCGAFAHRQMEIPLQHALAVSLPPQASAQAKQSGSDAGTVRRLAASRAACPLRAGAQSLPRAAHFGVVFFCQKNCLVRQEHPPRRHLAALTRGSWPADKRSRTRSV